MFYRDGETFWYPPMRYGQDECNEPMKECRIVGDQQVDKHVYVYAEEYGHNVYLSLPVFYREENAQAYFNTMVAMQKIIRNDEGDLLFDRILVAYPSFPNVKGTEHGTGE